MIATKYQFCVCQNPRDILLIVLNHLDSLRRVLTDINVVRIAEDLHNILVITYGRVNVSEMKNYLNSIRNYVQEVSHHNLLIIITIIVVQHPYFVT